ncbi:zinc ABC transporter [Cutibacterium acnes JCM 18918]|nr:zinc ABC transporter [Cutibacterium acnes JCM 18918]
MVFSTIINFDSFSQLVPLVRGSIIAGIILGVLAGLIGR